MKLVKDFTPTDADAVDRLIPLAGSDVCKAEDVSECVRRMVAALEALEADHARIAKEKKEKERKRQAELDAADAADAAEGAAGKT